MTTSKTTNDVSDKLKEDEDVCENETSSECSSEKDEYVNDDFLLQFNSELINSYYWFHEHRDIFTTFTLSIFASRFIDAL